MIRSGIETSYSNIITSDEGREVDAMLDTVRLVAINLELAVRNLMTSETPPECLMLTADICTHRLVAMPTADGKVSVLVYDI